MTDITVKHAEFQAQVKRLRIEITHSEVERFNQNHVSESEIGHPKKRFCQKMVSKKFPDHVWYYCLVHQDGILSSISCGKMVQTGIEEVTGKIPEISEWLDFEFYDSIWWLEKKYLSTTDDSIILG